MHSLRRWSVLILAVVASLLTGSASADWLSGPAPKQTAEKWLIDRSLTLTPAPVPLPALKYRLWPRYSERKEGNAVPIYLRLVFERNDAWRRELVDKPKKWNDLPLDQLPVAEIQPFLRGLSNFFQQIELGAQRRHADWNYTLDQGDVISILLPDAQTMAHLCPALVLKARVEMAQGHFGAAAYDQNWPGFQSACREWAVSHQPACGHRDREAI